MERLADTRETGQSQPAASGVAAEPGGGRTAETPAHIGLRGWMRIASRVWKANGDHNLSVGAAGVAFYSMLAVFPAFTAFVMLYGLVADPQDVQTHFVSLRSLIPNDAWVLLNDQLTLLTAQQDSELGWGLALGLVLAIWSSGAGIRALMSILNGIYVEREERGLVEFFGTAVLLTAGGIFAAMLSLLFIVGTPLVLELFILAETVEIVLDVLSWFVLSGVMIVGVGILYRFGPSRRDAKIRWLSVGSVFATAMWVLASLGFSFFVRNFGNYQETYGALGAIIVLLMWFWVTAYVVLIGAELNAQAELQTHKDTTVGSPRPPGARGAYVADHVARQPDRD